METTRETLRQNHIMYDLLSGYGQKYGRPLVYLFLSWLVFSVINFLIVCNHATPIESIMFAGIYSFYNMAPFLETLSGSVSPPKDHVSRFDEVFTEIAASGANIDCMMFLAFLQQFIGIFLLFFVLLGLRTRFRLN